LDLALPEGAYRLRGPQLPFNLDFRVQPAATAISRLDVASKRYWRSPRSSGPSRRATPLSGCASWASKRSHRERQVR